LTHRTARWRWEEHGKGGTPVLLIHGNSSCRDVFQHQLHAQLAENYRFIAFDLPGHGQSSDAPDPARTYTRPGLAEAAVELLEKLRITQVVVLGWSLGGHIGIEMMHLFPGLLGLMITGAPPVSRSNIAEGFHAPPAMGAAGKSVLSIAEIEAFVQAIFGDSAQPFFHDAVTRADARFRKTLFEAARTGAGVDQRLVVESGPALLAVVNGGADNIVNLDYFDTIVYANLWEGKCHRLRGLGHAPFWQGPRSFNPIFARFLRDVEIRHRLQIRSDRPHEASKRSKRRSNGPSDAASAV
jgi:pimeloyl-ACP methyl ester carboxylesterase